MDRSVVSEILAASAPLIDALALIQLPDDNWLLHLDEQLSVDIVLEPTLGRLVLSAEAGSLVGRDEPEVLRLLLSYNYAWSEHGGLRTALDDARNQLILLLDVPTHDLSPQFLGSALMGFADAVRAWSEALPVLARIRNEGLESSSTLGLQGVIRG